MQSKWNESLRLDKIDRGRVLQPRNSILLSFCFLCEEGAQKAVGRSQLPQQSHPSNARSNLCWSWIDGKEIAAGAAESADEQFRASAKMTVGLLSHLDNRLPPHIDHERAGRGSRASSESRRCSRQNHFGD